MSDLSHMSDRLQELKSDIISQLELTKDTEAELINKYLKKESINSLGYPSNSILNIDISNLDYNLAYHFYYNDYNKLKKYLDEYNSIISHENQHKELKDVVIYDNLMIKKNIFQ